MFPYPVCSWDECTKRDELTSDQIHTMENYAPLYSYALREHNFSNSMKNQVIMCFFIYI